MKTYTILIPCYNEAPTIGVVLENLTRAYPHIEIIVVDNNSNEGIFAHPHESVKSARKVLQNVGFNVLL